MATLYITRIKTISFSPKSVCKVYYLRKDTLVDLMLKKKEYISKQLFDNNNHQSCQVLTVCQAQDRRSHRVPFIFPVPNTRALKCPALGTEQ